MYDPNGKYGLYDTADHCWIGNDTGPLRYNDRDFADLARNIVTEQMNWSWARVRVRPYDGSGTQHKDTLATDRTVGEALRRLEGE